MGFKYPIKEHAGKGMMVQTFQDGIWKSNHLLFDELFKWKKNTSELEVIEDQCHLEVLLERERWYCRLVLRLQEGRDVDQP